MQHLHSTVEYYRGIIAGFLLVMGARIFVELFQQPLFFAIAIGLVWCAHFIAKKTTRHFHGHHHHAVDSVVDIVPVSILLLANVLHPVIDGISFWETLQRGGIAAASVVGVGIFFHEIIRQSALIGAFRSMGIKGYVVVITAIIALLSGVAFGVFNNAFFHQYELVADMATLFAYAFIMSEFFGSTHKKIAVSTIFIVVGVILGIFFWYGFGG